MLAIILIIGNIVLRLLPHIPNVAPITATALFGATYLKKRYAFIIPLIAMVVSDYLLLYINPFSLQMTNFHHLYPVTMLFHSTTLYVWGSFLISGVLGLLLRQKRAFIKVSTITFLASLQFFLITNLGVWAAGAYSRDLHGLLQSYLMGLPFFRYTLMGDFLYAAILFGGYELVLKLRTQNLKSLTLAK